MYKNLIYVEEYDIYQYFDGYRTFFSHSRIEDETTEADGKTKKYFISVISRNILFNVIPEKSIKEGGKFSLNRYIGKYYKNESYFYVDGANGGYGVYHTLPLNVKKYYSLFKGIDIVIPYDYLAASFLKEKFGSGYLKKNALFIEKTDDIYKFIVFSNGFCIIPVTSFKADMLSDNLNILKTKIQSKNIDIKIEQIIANCECGDLINFFDDAEILNFTSKDFFEYFENINKTIPHFENIEVKFKKIEDKKNIRKTIYITFLIFLIFIMEIVHISYGNKIFREKQKISVINKKISAISVKIGEDKKYILFNEHFARANISGFIKSFFALLPESIKIKKINIIKSGNHYIFDGTAFDAGGYREFAYDYNLISGELDQANNLKITYLFGKSGKPIMKFSGKLKNK